MAQQCIWASSAGRSGNIHVSDAGFDVQEGNGLGPARAAVCRACSATIGVFVDGQWFNVLRSARGRQSYEKAAFAQFGDQRSADAGADSPRVGKKVRV